MLLTAHVDALTSLLNLLLVDETIDLATLRRLVYERPAPPTASSTLSNWRLPAPQRPRLLRRDQHPVGNPRARAVVLAVGSAVLLGTVAWIATFPISVSI